MCGDIGGIGKVDEGDEGDRFGGIQDGDEGGGGVVRCVDREVRILAKPFILGLYNERISLR